MLMKWIWILGFSILHFILHLGLWLSLFLVTFGLTMTNFDTGTLPDFKYQFLNRLHSIRSFPLVLPAVAYSKFIPGLSGNLIILLNSSLWGFGLGSLAAMLFNSKNKSKS